MKKLLSIFAILTAAFLLFSCDKSKGPEDVAKKAITALQKGDYDAYAATFDLSESDQKMLAGLVDEKMKEVIDKKGGIKDYKILETNVDGETAKVKCKLIYKDGTEEDQNMDFKLVDGQWKQTLNK